MLVLLSLQSDKSNFENSKVRKKRHSNPVSVFAVFYVLCLHLQTCNFPQMLIMYDSQSLGSVENNNFSLKIERPATLIK